MKKIIIFFIIAILFIVLKNTYALNFGTNITIWDKVSSGNSWYGSQEDQEVEPNCLTGQVWDLEAFFLDGSKLTMVGGFNFKDGYTYYNRLWKSGDIFIDTNGDAKYGPDNTGTGGGNNIVNNSFGYEYAIRFNFTNMTFDVYQLDPSSTIQTVKVWYSQNDESNPWLYHSGGTYLSSGTLIYGSGNDSDIGNGLTGGTHYYLTVDLNFLAEGTQIISHFTYECGNDNLMGKGVITPEPATMLFLGAGLIGMGGFIRRRFKK